MKQSELLRKQADMIDMAELYGFQVNQLVRVRNSTLDGWLTNAKDPFSSGWAHRQFALGVVEGRPVFEGDTLYFNGIPARIRTSLNLDGWTWNPPKPRTVMVELLREDAENLAGHCTRVGDSSERVYQACRKALEESK